jgi:hypothetical protein
MAINGFIYSLNLGFLLETVLEPALCIILCLDESLILTSLPQGRPFAWQEGLMCLATIFQKFDFTPGDPSYSLQLLQTLTLKPKGFTFHAIPREGALSFSVAAASSKADTGAKPGKDVVGNASDSGKPFYVFYGSNTGSCEGFAQDLASGATSRGTSLLPNHYGFNLLDYV